MTPFGSAPARAPDPHAGFLNDVHHGLSSTPKTLPSKYFYDARGSALFETICEQPEYYLTRVELGLLEARGSEIAAAVGPGALVVEYGSGSAIKTRRLLAALEDPVGYVPIEISAAALDAATAALQEQFPTLDCRPLCADFLQPLRLPKTQRPPQRVLIFFPGSTLGNFEHGEALKLLRVMHQEMGAQGGALIGIDLQKDAAILNAAYNDAAGITAAFTLNLLARLNRELAMDFDLEGFEHHARYHPLAGRIETHLVSRRAQAVHLGSRAYVFAAGERMRVEYSHKYTLPGFAQLAARAGLQLRHHWTNAGFALVLLTRAAAAAG
jgi:L-histidine Nalpha-methyltransferase